MPKVVKILSLNFVTYRFISKYIRMIIKRIIDVIMINLFDKSKCRKVIVKNRRLVKNGSVDWKPFKPIFNLIRLKKLKPKQKRCNK